MKFKLRQLRTGVWSAIAFFLVILPLPACAADFPTDRALPQGFGVNIHTLHAPAQEFAMIHEAGFRWVRITLRWDKTEPRRGVYDWRFYDDIAMGLAQHGLRPLFILAYSNALYAPSVGPGLIAAPNTDAQRRAFVRWARAAARHYQDLHPAWEIWNEPDQDRFWPPQADPNAYARLALDTCEAVHEVDRHSFVIGPGSASAPRRSGALARERFLAAVLKADVRHCLNGISVHPYLARHEVGNTSVFWRDVRRLVNHFSFKSGVPFLVNSESGLSTWHSAVHLGASDADQARYLVKMMLLEAQSQVALSLWYDWRDDGEDPAKAENRFGIITTKGQPKPAWFAMKTMTDFFAGAQPICDVEYMGARFLAFTGREEDQLRLAIWSETPLKPLSVVLYSDILRVRGVTVYSNPISAIGVQANQFVIHPKDDPMFIEVTVHKKDMTSSCPILIAEK